MNSVLITGGTVVNAWGSLRGDVLIGDGLISAVGRNLKDLAGPDIPVIDASGCYVFPGIIDPHVQLEGKYKDTEMTDDFFSGTRSAAAGGITTIIDFAVQKQDGGSALEMFHARRGQADPKVCVDYNLHAGITRSDDRTLEEIKELVRLGAGSFKCYMTYRKRGRLVVEDDLLRIMTEVGKNGGLVEVHGENNTLVEYMTDRLVNAGTTTAADFPHSRTSIAEEIAVSSAALLSRYTGCDLYVHHVTSKYVVDIIADAMKRGIRVYGETCPQYLLIDDSVYAGDKGYLYVMNPPIRDKESQNRLWEALGDGGLKTVGTDHCSYSIAQKKEKSTTFHDMPAGVPGLETMLSSVYTYGVDSGRLSPEKMVEVLSLNSARIFGLYPEKGAIQPGADGDVVIYDPEPEGTYSSADNVMLTDFHPFEGMRVKGRVKTTILRGNVIYDNGTFTGEAGMGRFLPCRRK